MTESILIENDGWTARLSKPASFIPSRLTLLLHGYGGDETSMQVIARNFPANACILFIRAPYKIEDGKGYAWLPPGGGKDSDIAEYIPGLESMLEWLDSLEEIRQAGLPFDLVGFSQGAAAAYALGLVWPQRIHRLAGLAGFLPAGSERYYAGRPLQGKNVFIAHGRQDDRIRIETGYQAESGMVQAGAAVDFCPADIGHKLSASCHSRLVQFLSMESAPANQ